MKRREAKSKREKERYTHLNAEFQRIARRDKKAFLSNQCKVTIFASSQKSLFCINMNKHVHEIQTCDYSMFFSPKVWEQCEEALHTQLITWTWL